MNNQVENFGRAVEEMSRFFRGDTEALSCYLSKCIFYSGMGSNDYLNNYFMTDFYNTKSQFTPQAYASSLLQDYDRQLRVSIIFLVIVFSILVFFNYYNIYARNNNTLM